MSDSLFEHDKRSVVAGAQSNEDFVQRLDALRLNTRELLQVAVVYSRTDVDVVLRKLSQNHIGAIKVVCNDVTQSPEINYYSMSRTFGRKTTHHVSGSFVTLRTHFPDVWLFVTIEPSTFWKDGLSKLIDGLYPRFVRPFFTQPEIHSFVKAVQQEFENRTVRLVRISGRERLKSPGSRKKFELSIRWTDIDVDTAFRQAAETNDLFRSVALEILRNPAEPVQEESVVATISKYGYFNCTGRFTPFHQSVIVPMIDLAHQRLIFLSNRDRMTAARFEPRPVKIKYDSDVLGTAEQLSRLLDVMKRFKHGTCSVIHGNPYIHVSLVDNYDFSAADVWVVNRDDILIVPQVKTSEAALKRIVSHIFEHFKEGRLGEYKNTNAV
jgi:hypothetical protein